MSATMLDSFDSPMLDYQNDHDIPMQTNSDPWYQNEEHAMEDEVRDDASHVSIEVEMEGYDEQGNPEYEMVDTDENFDVHIQEPIDVEFHDASNNPSPYHQSLAIPDDNIEAATRTAADFHAAAKPPTPLSLSPQRAAEENTMVESPFPFSADVEQTFIPEETLIHHDSVEVPAGHTSPEGTIQKDVSRSFESHLPEPTIVEETQHVTTGGRHDQPIVTRETSVPLASIPGRRSPAGGDDESTANEHTSEVVTVQPEHGDAASSTIAAPAKDDPAKDLGHQQDDSPETVEEVGAYDNVSSAASSGDPHEISDGVYIDPPPPVLVSFTFEVPPVALFNAAPESPSTSAAPEHIVLLGDQPTLYYEPLSSVFEALRQEEHLHNIPGLLNGELVLNAYDLDLVMSEDYTFTQELTLHDLNVLHDGLRKSGPLRIQLKNAGPRFLDRYHALQQEVQQLELSVSQGGGAYPEQSNGISNENQTDPSFDNEVNQEIARPTTHEEIPTQMVKPTEMHNEENQAEEHSEELVDDLPPPPEDDEDDPALLEEAGQNEIVEQDDGTPHNAIGAENVDVSPAAVNENRDNAGYSEDPVQSSTTVPHETPKSVSEEQIANQDSRADAGVISSKDDTLDERSPVRPPSEPKERIEVTEAHRDVPEDREHEFTDNADELNLEFEEIYDEDDQSVTLSNEDIHEQDDDVTHADNTQSTSYEDSLEDEWEEAYEDHEDHKSPSIHEDPFLQEPTSKLHRAQSFGSSKRSISEAELDDFDDGDIPLSTSPGSKRPRTE